MSMVFSSSGTGSKPFTLVATLLVCMAFYGPAFRNNASLVVSFSLSGSSTSIPGRKCHEDGEVFQQRTKSRSATGVALLQANNNNEDEGEDNFCDVHSSKAKQILALPPARGTTISSSSMGISTSKADRIHNSESSSKAEFGFIASRKFELQYTCKICDTRNKNKISRKAYREGVVISFCQGCTSKHLIADNLGWNKFAGGFNDGETNIEEFMEAKGGDKVNRVSKDVWELENLYYCNNNNSTTGDINQ